MSRLVPGNQNSNFFGQKQQIKNLVHAFLERFVENIVEGKRQTDVKIDAQAEAEGEHFGAGVNLLEKVEIFVVENFGGAFGVGLVEAPGADVGDQLEEVVADLRFWQAVGLVRTLPGGGSRAYRRLWGRRIGNNKMK